MTINNKEIQRKQKSLKTFELKSIDEIKFISYRKNLQQNKTSDGD